MPVQHREDSGAERVAAPPIPALPGLSRVEPLGSGGMGTVFRAWQDDLDRPVAVKVLRSDLSADKKLREQFTREAHILARLDHPGIVPVHSAGEAACGPYYVMRLVLGASVDRWLSGADAFAVAKVFRAVAEALALAHAEGVLHRDVKPANVLVEPSGRPVLVDFGLSLRVRPGESVAEGEGLVGTLDYLAPEVLEGKGYSPASDIYALGATLYVALTGRVPFPTPDLADKLRKIREEDPPLPRVLRQDLPKPLQAICLKAIERSPQDRYESAKEMARDLDRFVRGDLVQVLPVRSRSLLRRKIELHLSELADWADQGLIDDHQGAALRHAYESIEERERGLLRGVFGSIPNLLLLVGIVVIVFGPLILQLMTWTEQGPLLRLGLPAAPLSLLAVVGALRWRAGDRRRAIACLFRAVLLSAPLAFALSDLAPPLRAVADANGALHPIFPGNLWLPADEAPAWMHAGARLLEWKLLATATAMLAAAAWLYSRVHSAAFLWIACLAGMGAVALAALLAGFREMPLLGRWLLSLALPAATLATGLVFDRSFHRDRAQPFYGLGFVALLIAMTISSDQGAPVALLGLSSGENPATGSFSFHGLLLLAAGLAAHHRGTALLRSCAAAPLFFGFLMTVLSVGDLQGNHAVLHEILLVAVCIGFLVLGLALHRNSLVLPAAIALPISVGAVSQRHVSALWAWATALVMGGAILIFLGFRMSTQRVKKKT